MHVNALMDQNVEVIKTSACMICKLQEVHLAGMHQVQKASEEFAKTTKIRLRTVQHITKNWKDSEEPLSSRKKCGRTKI